MAKTTAKKTTKKTSKKTTSKKSTKKTASKPAPVPPGGVSGGRSSSSSKHEKVRVELRRDHQYGELRLAKGEVVAEITIKKPGLPLFFIVDALRDGLCGECHGEAG